ncbi:hypothetical protein Hanom_Chr10g00958431 [Helianthus anomalus]
MFQPYRFDPLPPRPNCCVSPFILIDSFSRTSIGDSTQAYFIVALIQTTA